MNNKNLIVNQRKGREQGGSNLNWPANQATVQADGPHAAGGEGGTWPGSNSHERALPALQ